MTSAVIKEVRATLSLAVPLAAANVAQMAMGVTDTVMVGSLGPVPLAAVGLGANFYFTIAVVCQGVVSAVSPLAAFAMGAARRDEVGRITASAFVLGAVFAVPLMAALTIAPRALAPIGYDPALIGGIGEFLHAIVWGTPGFLGFAVLRSLLAALSRPRAIMAVLVFGIGTNALLNWLLIFGHLGLPALGLAGSGYASAINQWLMFLGLLCVASRLRREDWLSARYAALATMTADMARILKLGLPIAGLQAVEVGVFFASTTVMGLFGANALAAHQIALNCASVTFMVPLGMSQAATVRIAAERGSGSFAAARRAGVVALGLGIAFMSLSAAVFWSVPEPIVGAYIALGDPGNREVVALALRFLAVAAVFQIVDGLQAVAAGALRGYHDATVPMILAGCGYWGIGFAGGLAFAFPLGAGPIGLWWGFVLGLSAVAALLTFRLLRNAAAAMPSGTALGEAHP